MLMAVRTVMFGGLIAIAALTAGCGDDDNPAGQGEPEFTLATFTSGGSTTGPNEPPQPPSIVVEVGVAHMLLPVFQVPDTLYFGTRTLKDRASFTGRAGNTPNFSHLATRLTDGVDGTAMVQATHFAGSGSNSGPESTMFESPAEVTRNGPDLVGYTITGVKIEAEIDVTRNVNSWTMSYGYTVTILGH